MLKPKMATVCVASFLIAATPAAGSISHAEPDTTSANGLMDFCNRADTENMFKQGVCMGEVSGVWDALTLARKVCSPENVNLTQAANVVKEYNRRHPKISHERFTIVASLALVEAWPCETETKPNMSQ